MAVAGLAVAATLVGCGGSDSSPGATSTSVAPTSAPGSATTGANRAGTTATFCELTETFYRRLSTVARGLGDDPAQIRRFVDELLAASNEAAAAAPPEIAADAKLLTEAAGTYARNLEQAGYDPARIPADAAAVLSSAEVQAASQRIEVFTGSNCEQPDR